MPLLSAPTDADIMTVFLSINAPHERGYPWAPDVTRQGEDDHGQSLRLASGTARCASTCEAPSLPRCRYQQRSSRSSLPFGQCVVFSSRSMMNFVDQMLQHSKTGN